MLIGISGKIGSGIGEEWRSCRKYPFYEISNIGRLRSLDRNVCTMSNTMATKHGKLLKLSNYNGYLGAKLTTDDKIITVLAHILVATAFVDNPDNKPCVNHKDGNKHNNNYSNLEWVTYSENMQHASDNKLSKTGENHYNSKLKDKDVIDIRNKYATGKYTHFALSLEYRVSRANITYIINNKSRKQ